MKYLLTLIAIAAATAGVAAQGNLAVPYTADMQAGVVFATNNWNEQNPDDTMTVAQDGIAQCQAVFTSYDEQRRQAELRDSTVAQKWNSTELTDAERAQIVALLDSLITN